MDYGTLIRDAWTITWRYRFLWLIGLLAGGGAVMLPTAGSQSGRPSGGTPAQAPWMNSATDAVGMGLKNWASANIGLLIALGLIAFGIVLALVVASFIAKGGMAQATVDLATGRASSFATAWGAGVHLFWRYVGLWLLLGAAVMVVFTVIGAGVVLATLTNSPAAWVGLGVVVDAAIVAIFVSRVLELTVENSRPRWKIALAATLFAVPIFPALIVLGLGISIVVAFAQRAIAVEDLGPIEALRRGWQLLRTHLAESLLTWLINAALALLSGLAGLAAILGGLIVIGAVGAVVFALAGLGTPLFAYAGLGSLLLLIGVLTFVGITNTFFWSYWTLVYLRLSGRGIRLEAGA